MASALASIVYLGGLAAVTAGVWVGHAAWLGLVVGGSLLSASALGFILIQRVAASYRQSRVAP
jgi:hypothetical protein